MRATRATLGLTAAGLAAVLLTVLGDPVTSTPLLAGVLVKGVRHRRPRLAEEDGSLLIEVMVGAVVLAITTTAVLSGLDGAQDTGRRNKDRSEYSVLAQQDIERLRSMPIYAIQDLDQTRTVGVANVDYTVRSATSWMQDDASGLVSCTSYNPFAEYLKISSTVTSPASADHPVKETTLLTPGPNSFGTTGTATVLLTDRDANPLPGVTVSLSGPASYSETTNSLGCAIFRFVSPGTYTAEVSGGVSWSNEVPAAAPVTVNEGRSTLNPIEVDDPASLRAHFKTPSGSSTNWSRITLAHAKLPAGFKVYPNDTATGRFPSIDATNVFPHLDGYGVYAGSCEANNPAFWDADYFKPGVPGYVQLDPGENLVGVDVLLPVVTVQVTKRASRRARVTATQMDNPNGEVVCLDQLYDEAVEGVSGASGNDVATHTARLPFGRYRICVDDGTNRKTSVTFSASTNAPEHHALTPPSNPLLQTDDVNMTNSTGRVSGTCPSE